MTRYVITPDVAVRLVEEGAAVAPGVSLVAPTLLRSQVLAELYRRVAAGEMERDVARQVLDGIRALDIRLLGDRVLQARAYGSPTRSDGSTPSPGSTSRSRSCRRTPS